MKRLPLFFMLLLSGVAANAGDYCTKSHDHDLDLPCEVNETDYYVGGSFGRAFPHAQNDAANAKPFNSTTFLFGRRISDHFAIEGAYAQFGSFFNLWTSLSTNVHAYSATLFGKQAIDPWHYLSVYGRGGYARSQVTIPGVGHNWHGDWTYGVGLEIALEPTRQLYLRVGVDRYNPGALTVIIPGVYEPRDWINNYSATVLFNF